MSKASVVLCRRAVALSCLLALGTGCEKDEPPPPLPTPQTAVAPEAPLELKPEDAGKPPEPKPTTTRKSGGARSSSGGLKQCCTALRQNATSAPKPTSDYMIYAAGICDLAASQGKDKASVIGAITTALKGAGLPSGCK